MSVARRVESANRLEMSRSHGIKYLASVDDWQSAFGGNMATQGRDHGTPALRSSRGLGFSPGNRVAEFQDAPLYENPEVTRIFRVTARFIGDPMPGDEYRVLYSLLPDRTPNSTVIDGKTTVVVSNKFFDKYSMTQRIMVAAHEMQHVDDINSLGFETCKKLYKISRSTVEVSVQNRAMSKIVNACHQSGMDVPGDIMDLHNELLYDIKNGWVNQLRNNWEW